MRDTVQEEGLAGEVLEIGIVHPALPDALVGEPVDLLQEQDSDLEARLGSGSPRGRKTVRHLIVDPGPVDLISQPDQLVLHVDDLIEPGPKEITRAFLVALLWSHPMPLFRWIQGITEQPKRK